MSQENPKLAQVRALPMHRYWGVRDLEAHDGHGRLYLDVGETNSNPAGVLHGGVTYALCDVAAYASLLSVLDHAQEAATHDIHVSVMQPGQPGDTVEFSGRIVQRGKRLAFIQAQARAGDRLLATAQITKSIFTPR